MSVPVCSEIYETFFQINFSLRQSVFTIKTKAGGIVRQEEPSFFGEKAANMSSRPRTWSPARLVKKCQTNCNYDAGHMDACRWLLLIQNWVALIIRQIQLIIYRVDRQKQIFVAGCHVAWFVCNDVTHCTQWGDVYGCVSRLPGETTSRYVHYTRYPFTAKSMALSQCCANRSWQESIPVSCGVSLPLDHAGGELEADQCQVRFCIL